MRHITFQHELKRLGVPLKTLRKIEHERTTQRIVRESAKVVILSSLISSLGGFGLESVQAKLVAFLPFLILLPALNDMVGSFGATISSKFTTMLFMKKIHTHNWMHDPELKALFMKVMTVGAITSLMMGALAYGISLLRGFPFHWLILIELLSVSLLATMLLVLVLFAVSIIGGIYVHNRGHNPDNYLIPLTTAIGDLGGILIITAVLLWLV